VLSVSATTRPPRPGESEGREYYYFLTEEEFERRRRRGEFLEYAEVYGNWYGTLHSEVEQRRAAGQWVLLEIDVQGAATVFEQEPDAISIFLTTPSWEEYERRLRGRRTEEEAAIRRRLEGARRELEYAPRYSYRVVNDDVERTIEEICEILKKEAAHAHAR
ncbi:MAG: guanylate kinase, partial [Pirellulales bacterium]